MYRENTYDNGFYRNANVEETKTLREYQKTHTFTKYRLSGCERAKAQKCLLSLND